MSMTAKHVGLADALHAVLEKRASDPQWRLVRRAIADAIHAFGFSRDLDDRLQEVCVKLLRTRSRLEGRTDGAAAAFLKQATRNVIRDALRREAVRPTPIRVRTGEVDPIERVPARDPGPTTDADREAAAEDLLDRLLTEVELLIERSDKTSAQRQLAWQQTNATMCARLRGMEAPQIALELGVPGASSACIHKWVERGRPLLLTGLDMLAGGADPDELKFIAPLRTALAKRRKDAGKPRSKKRASKHPQPSKPGTAK